MIPDAETGDDARAERRSSRAAAAQAAVQIGGAVFALLAAMGTVFGQTAPVLPGPVAPGRVERQFQVPNAPPAVAPGAIPQVPEGVTAPPGADKIHFTLRELRLDGSTVYPADKFAPLYAPHLGQDVTLAEIYAIAADITARYRNDGYILSQVVVPAQQIADGKVRLQVVEGYVDRVVVEGAAAGKSHGLIDEYGRKITRSRPLRAADLERYLLLMNDLPGVSVRGFLHPSTTVPGAADLSIVVDRKPVDGYASVDNLGSRFVGPLEATLAANANNVLGLDDRTGLRVAGTARIGELQYLEGEHDEPIGTEGTRLNLAIYRSHSKPEGALADEDIDELDYTGKIGLSHPLIRSRSENLYLRGSFDVTNLDVEQAGVPVVADRLRVLRIGGSYDVVDTLLRPASNVFDVQLSRGLDAFGASQSGASMLSRPDGQADFTKVTFDATRQQPLTDHIALVLAATGQYSANSLLSSEQFGFGGAQFGRGYDPSQLLGDNGIAGKVELQYASSTGFSWLRDYQLYAFYDAGRVMSREPNQVNQPANRSAESTGVGLRTNLSEQFSGFVEFAQQLTASAANPGESGTGSRFLFGLVARLQ